ncbi:MAG: OmpH family outer membrane protein [Deltaproteobacteria bacterium]|nr:OmpH family outer membrane protein [Deltaproteobacteria bacterium]
MSKTNVTGNLIKLCAVTAVAAGLSVAVPAAAGAQNTKPAAAPAAQGTPAPKILVIDRSAILRASKVGQDIARQVKAYRDAAEKEFKGENNSLKTEGQALQQQLAILAPDVKDKKIRAFQIKEGAFQQKVQDRQSKIQGGVLQANQEVSKALGPILQGVMAERGANLLMDRNAIIFGTIDVDVTGVAIDRLNKKLPSVKVGLVALPPGVQVQQ